MTFFGRRSRGAGGQSTRQGFRGRQGERKPGRREGRVGGVTGPPCTPVVPEAISTYACVNMYAYHCPPQKGRLCDRKTIRETVSGMSLVDARGVRTDGCLRGHPLLTGGWAQGGDRAGATPLGDGWRGVSLPGGHRGPATSPSLPPF